MLVFINFSCHIAENFAFGYVTFIYLSTMLFYQSEVSYMLSSHDRVYYALCIEEPDRVPIFEPYGISGPTADIILGRTCIATNPLLMAKMLAAGRVKDVRKAIVKDNYEMVKKLGFDGGPILFLPTEKDPRPKMISEDSWIEYQVVGTSYVWVDGESVVRMTGDTQIPMAIDSDILRRGLAGFEDYVKKLEDISADEYEEMMLPKFQDYEENLGKLWKDLDVLIYFALEGTGTPHGGGWYHVYLMAFYAKPDLMRRYLSQHTAKMEKLIGLAADFGAELIYSGGDIAHNKGPMMSPKIYHEFLLPCLKRLADKAHKRGMFIFNSSDGNLWPIIDDYLINSDMDGMMEIQESAGMDIKRLKEMFGDRICFNGSVDSQTLLVNGTPEEVKRETKRVISILSPGGGHILSSSNSIYPGVKPENFFAMLETGRKYGVYRVIS